MLDIEKVRQDVAKIITPTIERQKPGFPWAILMLSAYVLTTQWVIAYLLFAK